MRPSSALFALAAPLLAFAAPARFHGKRAPEDILVLKFADVLEKLEANFYEQAMAKFKDSDYVAAGFTSAQLITQQVQTIFNDETTHSQVLRSTLKSFGEQPIECQYNFDSVLTDVNTMAAVARVVENVGVSAYTGGAILLTDPVILAAAGSILSVEARHSSMLNVFSGAGSAVPAAFDMALTPSEVLALASPFITGCNPQLPIPGNTPLTVTNTGSVGPGTLLTFQSASINGTVPEESLFCHMLVGGAFSSIALPLKQCVVPQGIDGPVYIWVTKDAQPLLNSVRDRAIAQQVAGPTLAFIDTKSSMVGQMVRASTGSGSGSGSGSSASAASTSTRTISPAEASAIVVNASGASASATLTNAGASNSPAPTSSASASSSSGVPQASSSGTASSSSAASSPSGSVAPPVGNAAAAPGPNLFQGESQDGSITVNGWKNV